MGKRKGPFRPFDNAFHELRTKAEMMYQLRFQMLDSEITSALLPLIQNALKTNWGLAQILIKHGWSDNSFQSPVNVQNLAEDLQQCEKQRQDKIEEAFPGAKH